MSLTDSEPDFQYDGRLVFNGLYETKVLDAEFDFEKIVEEQLKDFKRGTVDKPADGYEPLDFGSIANESRLLSDQLQELVSDVIAIRHKYEDWQERELPSGDIQDTRLIRSYDLYWDFPDYIAVKGDKRQARKATDLVNLRLDQYLTSRKIEFEPDFLLWIFYKATDDTSLTEHLEPRILSDASIEGEEDRYGKEVAVDKSTDITQSPNILSGILRNRDLIGLEGTFDARGQFVKANIQVGGRVHIKAANSIEDANDLERIAVSIVFLHEIMDAYLTWEELPGEEKYPPTNFFEDVEEECRRQGDEPTFSWDDVVMEYQSKRAGADTGAGETQAGLTDFDSEGD